MQTILNYHVIDPRNVGDLLSAPANYFAFPDYQIERADIRQIDRASQPPSPIILGGGGLLFPRFLDNIAQLIQASAGAKRIAWGVGQQIYQPYLPESIKAFDYNQYLEKFDLVGVRDYGADYPWVPCASCMHPAFDQKRDIKHEFVVFSHKKFQLNLAGFPRMTNDTQGLDQVLDFLGSGETILTSSYHGAYWGTLLGRKVLAFPFTSKFYTFKHPPALYPVQKWMQSKWQLRVLKKVVYELHCKNKFTCSTAGWQAALKHCAVYPESLEENRSRNRQFHAQVLDCLAD